MSLFSSSRLNVRSGLREIVIVTVSVLLAFALNAWWANRSDVRREQAYLHQMLADVQDYKRHLRASMQHDRHMQQSAFKVLEYIHSDTPAPPFDSLALWVVDGFNFSDVRPIQGTFKALIQSGDLNLIQNDSLRNRIVAATGYMDYTLQKLLRTEQDLSDAFVQLAYDVDMMWLAPHWPTTQAPEPTAPRFQVNAETLRHSQELNGAMFTGYTQAAIRLLYLNRLLDEVRSIERLLEAELDK